jgi:hypothetical protein
MGIVHVPPEHVLNAVCGVKYAGQNALLKISKLMKNIFCLSCMIASQDIRKASFNIPS